MESRGCIICQKQYTQKELRQARKVIMTITTEEREKQIHSLFVNSCKINANSTGLNFCGKECHFKCLMKLKRQASKKDDPNGQKKRRRIADQSDLKVIFDLIPKLSFYINIICSTLHLSNISLHLTCSFILAFLNEMTW